MAGVPGDATKDDIEKQLAAEVRAIIEGSTEGRPVTLSHEQAQSILEWLPEPEAEPAAKPAGPGAATRSGQAIAPDTKAKRGSRDD